MGHSAGLEKNKGESDPLSLSPIQLLFLSSQPLFLMIGLFKLFYFNHVDRKLNLFEIYLKFSLYDFKKIPCSPDTEYYVKFQRSHETRQAMKV